MNSLNKPPSAAQTDMMPGADLFGSPRRIVSADQDFGLSVAGDILDVVRRGKWILMGCLAATVALGIVYLIRTPPQYSASAQVILEPRRLTPQEATTGVAVSLDSAQAESQMQVIKSERNLATVFDALDLAHAPEFARRPPGLRQHVVTALVAAWPRIAPMLGSSAAPNGADERSQAFEAFVDRVSVRRIGQSYVLEISYLAPLASQASRLANSITAAYVHSQIERKLAGARRGAEFLENRVSSLESEEATAATAIREGVIPTQSLPDAESRVISAAREPLARATPQTSLILAFAVAVGLLIGSGILAIRHSLDRRVRSRGQIWRHFGLPCLAVLPAARRLGLRRLPFDLVVTDAKAPYAQALRAAYTSIVTSGARDLSFRSLGIASWRSGEGKSTLAGNLAHFIAATGEPVRLIDADLQDPTLSESLLPQATAGLYEMLTDHGSLQNLRPHELRADLGFVPARGRYEPYRPNLFLGAPPVGRFLAGLRETGDVIVDLPAMERSPHAQAVAGFLDGIILVVESGRTTLDEVALAVRTLEAARATLIGVVLNKGVGRLT